MIKIYIQRVREPGSHRYLLIKGNDALFFCDDSYNSRTTVENMTKEAFNQEKELTEKYFKSINYYHNIKDEYLFYEKILSTDMEINLNTFCHYHKELVNEIKNTVPELFI